MIISVEKWCARSRKEIQDRISQELVNLRLWMLPPRLQAGVTAPSPLPALPDPSAVVKSLQATSFAAEISSLAAAIRKHSFPLLGVTLETGPEIRWRRDYASNKETGLDYFRRVPYLDANRAGDHKLIWELNRHQHLVVLAQDFRLHSVRESLDEIVAELESWFLQNPFHRGINWASALEVAFRALSWIWIWHLAGAAFDTDFRRRFLNQLYLHALHLENNLSYYFSPNTHLLGEAVALNAIGLLFSFPECRRWKEIGAREIHRQMETQVRADGSHFEQSTYYHVYALDMFLFHAILEKPGATYYSGLAAMSEYLDALLGPAREIPFLGDDDGGRFFHPYGIHAQYGRATLAACSVFLNRHRARMDWPSQPEDLAPMAAWWLGVTSLPAYAPRAETGSRLFPDAGIAVLSHSDLQVVFDAGSFGRGSAGHSHSDTLSLVARQGPVEILIDSGTFTYVSDPEMRAWFRGSAAHNTIQIDGLDQAKPAGPFKWDTSPEVRLIEWSPGSTEDHVEAECRYGAFLHRRRLVFLKSGALFVTDLIDGPPDAHQIQQFWHLGSPVEEQRFAFADPSERMEGWRSTAFARKQRTTVLRVQLQVFLPRRLATAIALKPGLVSVKPMSEGFRFTWKPEKGAAIERLLAIK